MLASRPAITSLTSLKPLGWLLVIISLLAVVALLHHPIAHGTDVGAVLASMRQQAPVDRVVHGSLTVIFGLLTAGMFVFASRLGTWRFPVLLGLVSFSCALVLLVLAAITDGFIAPAIVEGCSSSSGSCTVQTLALLTFGGMQIEYLTRFALVAISAAVLSWSVALLRTPVAARWSGVVGLASGGLQVGALLVAMDRLSPHSLLFVMAGQIAWYLIVATLMITGRVPFGAAAA